MKPLTQEQSPTSVTSQNRRLRVDAILISSDDSFLIELGPLLGDNYRTHTVDSPLALGNLAHKPGWFAIVDVAALPEARGAVTRMAQRYPHAPIIVVTPTAADWSSLVGAGSIVDAIPRSELSRTRFNEALSKAVARVREAPRPDITPTGTYRGANPLEANPFGGRRHISLPGLRHLPWAALALTVLGVGLWWWHSSHGAHSSVPHRPANSVPSVTSAPATDSAEPAPEPQPSAPATTSSQTVLELLSAARVQFHDQKLLFPRPDGEPRGDSALELYAQVLSQDPSNAEALDGIERLWVIAKERLQGDIASGKLEDAARLSALFKTAGLSDERLEPLNAGINAARPRWLLARAQQSIDGGDLAGAEQIIAQLVATGADADTLLGLRRALDAKRNDQQLSTLSAQMHSAIASGALLAPDRDNAMARFTTMRSLNRSHTLTLAAQRDLRAALLTQATQATQQHQFDAATRYMNALSELGSSSEVTEAKRRLQEEMDRAAHPEPTAATAPAAPVPTPEPTPAPSAAASYIAATPVRPLDVSYPIVGRGVEGRVVVEFTLHANGTASDAVVIEANPRGVFDRSALSAVRRGRYDTRPLAGAPTQRARISLHFKPE